MLEALRAGAEISRILLAERIERGRQIEEIIELARSAQIPVEPARRKELDRVSNTSRHQGVIALAADPHYTELEDLISASTSGEDATLLVVLDGIEDPQNLGAIARTVDGAGGQGLVIPERRAAGISPGAIRASAGALEHVAVSRVTNLVRSIEQLKTAGIWTVGLTVEAMQSYTEIDFTGDTAIVVGSEGAGLSRLVREKCDFLASIPLLGKIESLNASVATSIILYEAVRQRQIKAGAK